MKKLLIISCIGLIIFYVLKNDANKNEEEVIEKKEIVIFNNFDKNDYQRSQGHGLGGSQAFRDSLSRKIAQGFTSKNAGIVTDMWLALRLVEGDNRVIITINDDLDNQPNQVLAKFDIKNKLKDGDGRTTPLHIKVANLAIQPNQMYWVVATSLGDSHVAWNENRIGQHGDSLYKAEKFEWKIVERPQPAMRVILISDK